VKFIKRLYKGACYSNKYGSHPGLPFMVFLPLLGAVAGSEHGPMDALYGFLFMFFAFFPFFLMGCYGRGK